MRNRVTLLIFPTNFSAENLGSITLEYYQLESFIGGCMMKEKQYSFDEVINRKGPENELVRHQLHGGHERSVPNHAGSGPGLRYPCCAQCNPGR